MNKILDLIYSINESKIIVIHDFYESSFSLKFIKLMHSLNYGNIVDIGAYGMYDNLSRTKAFLKCSRNNSINIRILDQMNIYKNSMVFLYGKNHGIIPSVLIERSCLHLNILKDEIYLLKNRISNLSVIHEGELNSYFRFKNLEKILYI